MAEIMPAIPKELEPLAVEARKYKSAEEFVSDFLKDYKEANLFPAQIKWINDPTALGEGMKLHEFIDWGSEVKFKLGKGWHSKAVEAEVNYYRSLVSELNKYAIKDIDNVVLKRLAEKYGKDLYGLEISKPIPFKAKSRVKQEIYDLIVNKLEKVKPVSSLTDFYTQATKGIKGVKPEVRPLTFADLGRIGTIEITPEQITKLKTEIKELPKITEADILAEKKRLYDMGKRAGFNWAQKPFESKTVQSYLSLRAIENVVAKKGVMPAVKPEVPVAIEKPPIVEIKPKLPTLPKFELTRKGAKALGITKSVSRTRMKSVSPKVKKDLVEEKIFDTMVIGIPKSPSLPILGKIAIDRNKIIVTDLETALIYEADVDFKMRRVLPKDILKDILAGVSLFHHH